ncbi:MAG: cation diffusion facilitator family transporter [Chloroflexi bacterium]|nr:cation diffusion facilitator family transporter [Chloroflexota bacterium]
MIVLGLTTAYMLTEVVGGLLTNSLALLADAGHMLTDILGLTMALVAIRFAQRPATPSKTYGFFRMEILAALGNSVVLLGIAAFITYEAWERFQTPLEVQSIPMLAIAVGGLMVNLIGVWLLRAGAGESLNVQGAFLELLSDLLGSLGVIIAAGVIFFTGWLPADPLISVVIGLFILPRTWYLLKSALDVLLEAAPTHIKVAEVEATMRSVSGVLSVHDLHIWTITSGFVAMSGHVLIADRPSADVLHDLQSQLRPRFGINHMTLQVEDPNHAEDGACCMVDPRCLVVGAGVPALATANAVGSDDDHDHGYDPR